MTQSNRLSELRGRMSASRARAGSSAFSGKSLFMGGDGDLSITAQPVVSGIELAHICNANKLCLGKVGETKMCLQVLSSGTSRCNTASHANKVNLGLTSKSFLAVKGNARTAFCQPCLGTEDLDTSLVESLLLRRADVDWGSQFNLINCEEVKDLKNEEDITDQARTVKKSKRGYSTPMKGVPDNDVLLETQQVLDDIYHDLKALDDVTIALENVGLESDETKRTGLYSEFQAAVASKLDLIVFHALTTHEWNKDNSKNINGSFTSLEETVAGLRALISMLDGQIGVRGGIDKSVETLPPTVWGSLKGLSEKVSDFTETLEAVGDLVLALETTVFEVKEQVSASEESMDARDTSTGSDDVFFEPVRRKQGQRDILPTEAQLLHELDKRTIILEKREIHDSSQIAVVVRDHILRSSDDVGALLEKYMGVPCDRIPAGAFMSPQNLLNQIVSRLSGTTPELRYFKALVDLKLGKLERDAAASCMKPLPTLCTGNRLGSHVYGVICTGCRFKMIPTFKGASDEDALCHKFNRELRNVVKSTRAYIESEIGLHTELVLIANTVLNKSTQFVESIFQFVSDTYESMVLSFKNPADTWWDLVCSSVEQIFSSQFKGPLSSMVVQDFTNVKRTLLDTIWTTLRINVVVEDFLRVGLKDHHCLVGAANRFMIKQYAKSSSSSPATSPATASSMSNETKQAVEAVSKKVKTQAEEIKQLKKLVSELSSQLKSVESRTDQALNAVRADQGKKKKKREGENSE